jgi:uncharacterized protein YbcC (UPF0753/DUF2309 family)
MMSNISSLSESKALVSAKQAARQIPPLWPLTTSVAVNPFLGQAGKSLESTAALLERVAGIRSTMPRSWFAKLIAAGDITDADLEAAADDVAPHMGLDPAALRAMSQTDRPAPVPLPTIADLAADATGTAWPEIIADRIGAWAAGYFDQGQAFWMAEQNQRAYSAWRATAMHDLTPEILGLTGFAARIAASPQDAEPAIRAAVADLGVEAAALETYFHQLLLGLGGWTQYARHIDWNANLAGKIDPIMLDFLAIRLSWEQALLAGHRKEIESQWRAVVTHHAAPVKPHEDDTVDAILQEAFERSRQRRLAATLKAESVRPAAASRPILQAAFCIDVRSEVIRRALEGVSLDIETLGFAGFFGLATTHHRFASDVAEQRLPVLLRPSLTTRAGTKDDATCDSDRRITMRAKRAWGRFRLAAVSSFAFVEAAGPLYAARLVRSALRLPQPTSAPEPAPRFDPQPNLEMRIDSAASILQAMSLTQNFARVIILAGHGASVVNNPHASSLNCGACGGHAGDVNARLLAGLLNDPDVRAGLGEKGITIPEDTVFVGALHDTTRDEVTLYDADTPAPEHGDDLKRIKGWLEEAGRKARLERRDRLPGADSDAEVIARASDWAQTRPEWGLAGCEAFIAAPREHTAGRDLSGRTFLHTYDWKSDEGFGVLELIMTAPVVVASWISLQYYGSVVAPDVFGAGNKLLHNATGGIGVLEGNGGLLRGGLPWQSVQDGEAPAHEPLRLTIMIEAPLIAMSEILDRNPAVADLFDNTWLHLLALDENGRVQARYSGHGNWEAYRNDEVMAA